MALTSYYVALGNPDQAADVAKSIESALLKNGVQATSIQDEIKEGQKQSTGFLYIIQGFMGLGLLVGVAAVGVIAFRSVVERRQQIGVLRALGYQREAVSLSFMIETAFVVGMGVLSGTVLGLMLSRNLFMSDETGSEFTTFLIPWEIITIGHRRHDGGRPADDLDPGPPGHPHRPGRGAALRVKDPVRLHRSSEGGWETTRLRCVAESPCFPGCSLDAEVSECAQYLYATPGTGGLV